VKITLFEAAETDSFTGKPELHVRVLSNQLVDLPQVRAALSAEQAEVWSGYVAQPHYFYPAERGTEGHDYTYDDEWHFHQRLKES
jgi:hypothetical protein